MSPRRSKVIARAPRAAKSGSKGRETPMMEQFWRAKKEAPDALLFFRMGDFYELFHDDAVTAAREIGLTLTSRSKGEGAIPMAGIPVKSAEGYLLRLVGKGHKVAICEQLQDPRHVKGIVDRGIVRIVTPGTITEENALDAREENALASAWVGKQKAGIAWVDLSTGRCRGIEIEAAELLDELARLRPAELLLSAELARERPDLIERLHHEVGVSLTERDEWRFETKTSQRTLNEHFGVLGLDGFGVEADSAIIPAAGALIEYVKETQRGACEHLRRIERVRRDGNLILDHATRSCLELVVTQREARREGTLLDTLDATRTPMGSRLLREWVLSPLRDVESILRRQRGVAELVEEPFRREELRDVLDSILDVERLVGRISTRRCNGRDLVALARSLEQVPGLRERLADPRAEVLAELREALDPLEDVTRRIAGVLVDEPPLTVREGGLVRDGCSDELDELRRIAGDGKSWMARFQAEESERSGIQGLKIGYNSVFGYFIEIPRGQVERVPEHYVRKQTIKTAERYITPELKEFETKVLKAEERSRDLEYDLFVTLRDEVAEHVGRVLDTAHAIARLDILAGLAQVAADYDYVAPVIDDGDAIDVKDGRHPVLERSPACEAFVPNDVRLDRGSQLLTILTGPNMAGKSTYIRQTALIVLLAQMGSFVPASEARIGVVDRIFTRVGAGDDISRGESTFMVEMVEIANILNNATSDSLVILDEVGRGTSTFDGLALAWAIAEHLHEVVGARTLFATHYHQLTDLTERYAGVANKNVAVREWGEEIVFLHKIVDGGTDRSYGIHVARLAGVPAEVLERSRSILADLEQDEEGLAKRILEGAPAATPPVQQLGLFSAAPSKVEAELRRLDLDQLTPIDALLELRRLKDELDG
jgi:DNA mismatch repair protein MutS